MYKVKANEKLFNEWKRLGYLIQGMGSVVQNYNELDSECFDRFSSDCKALVSSLKDLTEETISYVETFNCEAMR